MSGGGVLNLSELDDFAKELMEVATEKFPRETKNFMGRAGNKLARNVRAGYKAKTKRRTGNLYRGVRRGRPYIYNGNEIQCRVKNIAPHAQLLERGHVMKDKNGKTIMRNGHEIFVPGKHVVGIAANSFSGEFDEMADKFVDEMLEGGKL